MDADEVDSWYDQQKEKAFAELLKGSEKNKAAAEKKYHEQLKSIRVKYEKLFEKSLVDEKKKKKREEQKEKLKEMIDRVMPKKKSKK